jgi:hypothetical protein
MRAAVMTAAVRERTSSLARMLATWQLMVRRLT